VKTPPEDLAEKLYGLSEGYLAQGAELRIDEVARAIDVPRATLYYYFAGRDDLLSFLMAEKAARMGTAVRKALADGGSVTERLERVLDAMVGAMAEQPSLCVNLLAAMGQGEAMLGLVLAAEQAVFVPLRELLIEGRATGELDVTDLDVACAGLAGAVLLASVRAYVTTGAIDADAVSSALTAELVDGLRAR
jgi:AcrR family transcriptional regulator